MPVTQIQMLSTTYWKFILDRLKSLLRTWSTSSTKLLLLLTLQCQHKCSLLLKEAVHAHRSSLKVPVMTAQLVQSPMVVDVPPQTDVWTMRSAELLLTATDANHVVLEQLQTSQAQYA
jgi:hypothetical protein